jgi:hypothetical protein
MALSPGARKLALTAHVTASVGWLGAVAAFLAVAIAGLTSDDVQVARAAYIAMNLMGWYVIVPLGAASLVTGIVQSLGTPWGLLRHWWIVIKLLLTVLAMVVLLVHMRPIGFMADVAARTALAPTTTAPCESSSCSTPAPRSWRCWSTRPCRSTSHAA